ncbi:MAG: ArsR family transcriptional regulator [Methanobacteriota archaeon]|nr:MAG: ArsR family transcriptional regulator [Euryarchaeota archaeon]
MTICIIYHSYSGITRGIAEKVQAACGGDLVEVRPRTAYTTLTAYTVGCMRARNETPDPIEPASIDVSAYDLIVIGTPVWAWKATPAINGAVAALKGCQGKRAVLFATCGAQTGDTLPILAKALGAKGVEVVGQISFNRKEIDDTGKLEGLFSAVKAAEKAS